MKFLIWFLCIYANALITTLIKEAGVILGAIPTVILYGATFWLARPFAKNGMSTKKAKQRKRLRPYPCPKLLRMQIKFTFAESAVQNSLITASSAASVELRL